MMEIEKTADGSHTLFVPELNEHYHSVKGAMTESAHIFIGMGLQAAKAQTPHILEIGFGTGLNAFLTCREAIAKRRKVFYTTLERYPLPLEMVGLLNYAETEEAKQCFLSLHEAEWNKKVELCPYFVLEKRETDFTTCTFDGMAYDVIYFDAFAPEKQPEMWSETLMTRLYESLRPEGILTTYCAKGEIRRTLQRAGFTVERLPGPPNGKREILRARK